MPGRAGAEGARYICPQCFTDHYQNDVLFASWRLCASCDRRRAAHRYAVDPNTAFAQWCRGGNSEVLLDWRALPPSRRRWENGAIAAVRDLDGSWVRRRVCPCCHEPLLPLCSVVIGWEGTGMNSETASRLLRDAAEAAPERWKISHGGLPLRYEYLADTSGAAVLGVPVELGQVEGGYGDQLRRRCCAFASGVVVRLQLQLDKSGGLDDMEAIRTLDALLESLGYSDARLKVSAVFLLEGLEDQPDAAELFQKECPQLARLIQYDFESSYFAAVAWDGRAAVQAVEWLMGRIKGLHAGD